MPAPIDPRPPVDLTTASSEEAARALGTIIMHVIADYTGKRPRERTTVLEISDALALNFGALTGGLNPKDRREEFDRFVENARETATQNWAKQMERRS